MNNSQSTRPDRPASESARSYPRFAENVPAGSVESDRYRVRFATSEAELDELLRLRFEVFNVELHEGLDESWKTGHDRDEFDAHCHHLIVEERHGNRFVGTYRLQTGEMARSGAGFYAADEFDLGDLPSEVLGSAIETGRACIHRRHRNRHVLFLLWKGLARYIQRNRSRYYFGCCSVTTQDPAVGWGLYEQFRRNGQLHPELNVPVRPDLACERARAPDPDQRFELPTLFRTYLRYGSKVISEPAVDRKFKTIDYLVLLDTEDLSERSRRIFFG